MLPGIVEALDQAAPVLGAGQMVEENSGPGEAISTSPSGAEFDGGEYGLVGSAGDGLGAAIRRRQKPPPGWS